tara:strand:- start:2070 stop:3179 length:1110 start_codon:yes stop_codon:yes gene_type:complete
MRKLFILGGSALQLDLILEAKKLFFYVIVLDMDETCIGKNWCDEFLHIDICDKEAVLKKAIEYKIDAILTSATELGNITACYVGEKLELNTNNYECALNTTNKMKMKEILKKHNIKTANYKYFEKEDLIDWKNFPCIVKPVDSSGGRGVYFCHNEEELANNYLKTLCFSRTKKVLVEEYIKGEQFSCETISVNGKHQLITITKEYIRDIPNIVETHQQIPANITEELNNKIEKLVDKILEIFEIKFGAGHIEIRIDDNENIYVVELASRIGGWRTEMLNLAYGISFSQLLLFSSLGVFRQLNHNRPIYNAIVKIILSFKDYEEYLNLKQNYPNKIFEPRVIKEVEEQFLAYNLVEAKGYYFILEEVKRD